MHHSIAHLWIIMNSDIIVVGVKLLKQLKALDAWWIENEIKDLSGYLVISK